MDFDIEQVANALMKVSETGNSEEVKELDKVDVAINEQMDKRLNELKNNEIFKRESIKVLDKKAEVKLKQALNEVLSQEQQNEYAEYLLKCEKEKLNYRKKREKKLIKEEIESEIQQRKINALKMRYGYLYKDETSFVPNKFTNIIKELSNIYENSSITFKKIVNTTIRLIVIVVSVYIVYRLGETAIKWFLQNIDTIGGLIR